MTLGPAVTVENVSKRFRIYHERNQTLKAVITRRRRARYEEFWAVKDVSFEVPHGTTFGLVGHNGSGKSTLLKCLARILRPEQGRLSVEGKVSALLELGAGFHPELSGRENVFLNGSILGLGTKELTAKFDEIVAFAGLERFIDSPVKNYSSGMYVRLGFSVAINVNPDVLLIDEVLAVGDEQFQRQCNEKIADLKADGRTIVVVSHALATVRNLCDKVGWLEHGELKGLGDPGPVIDEYVGGVHLDRETDEAGGSRWGSGEGRIERVEVLGPDGASTTRVNTGDPVTFRLHYHTYERLDQPVLGLGIHRLDGCHVTGPNTRDAGLEIGELDGKGHVDLVVDRLLLLPGTYDLDVSLFDHTCLHPFDFRPRVLRLDVEPGWPREQFGGVVSLGGRWSVD